MTDTVVFQYRMMLTCNLKLEINQPVLSISAFNDFMYGKINEYLQGYLWFDLRPNALRYFERVLVSPGQSAVSQNMPSHHFGEFLARK